MKCRSVVVAITSACMIGSAMAQTPPPRGVESGAAPRQDAQVRVQSNITFFLPGPTNDGEDAQKLRDRARRIVYEMAGHECDVLRETLARDCRLESVNNNINVNRSYGQQQPEGYNVNGTLSLQITLK
jgi:hypothetical protein